DEHPGRLFGIRKAALEKAKAVPANIITLDADDDQRAAKQATQTSLLQTEDELRLLGARLESQKTLCARLEQEIESHNKTSELLEDRRFEIQVKTALHTLAAFTASSQSVGAVATSSKAETNACHPHQGLEVAGKSTLTDLSPSAAEAVRALQELAAKRTATMSEAGPSESDVSDYDEDEIAERFKALADQFESAESDVGRAVKASQFTRVYEQFGLTDTVEWSKDEVSVMMSWVKMSAEPDPPGSDFI
ncbi:hypothetical protein KFL_008660010, partial [Klebsormidium nitens]